MMIEAPLNVAEWPPLGHGGTPLINRINMRWGDCFILLLRARPIAIVCCFDPGPDLKGNLFKLGISIS